MATHEALLLDSQRDAYDAVMNDVRYQVQQEEALLQQAQARARTRAAAEGLDEAGQDAAVAAVLQPPYVHLAARAHFLDSPGGYGKTFLFNLILSAVRSEPHGVALAMGTSGIGALLLDGGTTFHSRTKCPLRIDNA
jgi:hypothetical protein